MLHKLYDWTLSLAARKTAEVWLAVIAFIESSVFLVPADVLFLPMALARPARAYRFALDCHHRLDAGRHRRLPSGLLRLRGRGQAGSRLLRQARRVSRHLRSCTGEDTLMMLLVTSGLSHLPPIKVVTILAGVAQISFVFFVVSCVIARGARFFALAWALRRFGEPIRDFIERRLGLIAALAAACLDRALFHRQVLWRNRNRSPAC